LGIGVLDSPPRPSLRRALPLRTSARKLETVLTALHALCQLVPLGEISIALVSGCSLVLVLLAEHLDDLARLQWSQQGLDDLLVDRVAAEESDGLAGAADYMRAIALPAGHRDGSLIR